MRLRFFILIACLFLSGFTWSKTMIYSGMKEQEINEMLVLLLSNNIDSTRAANKDGFSIHVDSTQVARALRLVHSYGLPRDKFLSLGDVFSNDGIISSPQQEQIRFVYALSQEMEETISNIENVLVARVHIVLVSDNDLGETLYPSSASVFIKHRSNSRLPQLVPRIKQLVANSVPGLTYEKVNVVLFETTIPELSITPAQPVDINWTLVGGGGIAVLVLLIGGVVLLYRRTRKNKPPQVPSQTTTEKPDSLDFAVQQETAKKPQPKSQSDKGSVKQTKSSERSEAKQTVENSEEV